MSSRIDLASRGKRIKREIWGRQISWGMGQEGSQYLRQVLARRRKQHTWQALLAGHWHLGCREFCCCCPISWGCDNNIQLAGRVLWFCNFGFSIWKDRLLRWRRLCINCHTFNSFFFIISISIINNIFLHLSIGDFQIFSCLIWCCFRSRHFGTASCHRYSFGWNIICFSTWYCFWREWRKIF